MRKYNLYMHNGRTSYEFIAHTDVIQEKLRYLEIKNTGSHDEE